MRVVLAAVIVFTSVRHGRYIYNLQKRVSGPVLAFALTRRGITPTVSLAAPVCTEYMSTERYYEHERQAK